MIGFELTDEQRQLQELAREFAINEMRPASPHHDETGEFPREVLKKAHDLGLMDTHIPTAAGGMGLGVLDGVIVAEETAYGCTGIMTAMEANGLAQAPLIVAGSEAQWKKFLGPMTEELKFAAYCVTEPGAGSDVAGLRTTAAKVGNDYVLNGAKMWITNAGVADWYFVLAYTDKEKAHKGMTGFIVDRHSDGIEVGKKEMNMGQRCSDTRAVVFTDVKVPAENVLGQEGDGFKIAMSAFDHTRPPVAAGAVGLARAAMDHAIEYSQQRTTFGKPIFAHQAISFMIADMAMKIDAGRFLVWHAAWLKDNGKRNTKQAAMAKAFAADMAMEVATNAVQVYGGYGYSKEYPVEKLMRDAKIYQIYEGTSQIQRLIISKELFTRNK